MDSTTMQALVNRHLRAEEQGDIDGSVAVYTDNIDHDAVGFPNRPSRGKDGARDFCEYLTANFRTAGEEGLHPYVTDGAMILEQRLTGTVILSLNDSHVVRGAVVTGVGVGAFADGRVNGTHALAGEPHDHCGIGLLTRLERGLRCSAAPRSRRPTAALAHS